MSEILPAAATFSKSPRFFSGDPSWHPETIVRGLGARVMGDDGAWYLDWVGSLGSNLLGHADPAWTRRVRDALWDGTGFSLPHYLEQQVAEKLVAVLGTHVPGWQPDGLSVRFGLSGSDACAAAVRLARAVTGREHILSIGYHGWASEFVAATPPHWGVTEQPIGVEPFGAMFTRHLSAYAAVIVEQPPQEPSADYWPWLRSVCDKYGALLILDEVVTGLRFALGGAAEQFDIRPDIVCMGKGLGNGVPISAMVFPRNMASWFSRSDPVFVSSTHFGCTIGLASADYILDNWTAQDVGHLWRIGDKLMVGLRDMGLDIVGYPPVSLCKFKTPAQRAFFIAGMRDRGILFNRPNIPCRAHTLEDVEHTIDAAQDVLADMVKVDVEAVMAGKLPQVLFENR